MKRNLDLIRTILREIEKKPDGSTYFKVSPPEGVEMSAFMAHLELLIDAGFIKGKVGEYALRSYEINRLTWQGHEFLGAPELLVGKSGAGLYVQTACYPVSYSLKVAECAIATSSAAGEL